MYKYDNKISVSKNETVRSLQVNCDHKNRNIIDQFFYNIFKG